MKVGIHQPNFFPWQGYFDKISKCDIFVFMDNVAYSKSGNSMGAWTNRVKALVQGQPMWISCPVIREHGAQIIKDVKINNQIAWRDKLLKTIQYNYRKSAYYDIIIEWFSDMLYYDTDNLAEYNIKSVLEICSKLSIDRKFIYHSALGIDKDIKSTDLLIEIVKAVGGSEYMCGGGASGYQEDDKFDAAGIKLTYQNFKHTSYSQLGKAGFVAGLSIIDYFMNCGFDNSFLSGTD